MTEEQIKQNAEICVFTENSFRKEHKKLILTPSEEKIAKDFYIAGAHSRDEEIEELKKSKGEFLVAVAKHKKAAIELEAALDQFRNPWISVEERLPEKIKNKGVSKHVFVTWPDGTRGEAYYNYEEYKAPRWEIKGAGIMKPAYWMPIPELKKE